MRDQLHAENFVGKLAHFFHGSCKLDATALTPATGMNLRLDDPDGSAELFGGADRLFDRKRGNAARNDHAKLPQQFLALILMDFHGNPVRSDGVKKGIAARYDSPEGSVVPGFEGSYHCG